jgi:hypothetical protein
MQGKCLALPPTVTRTADIVASMPPGIATSDICFRAKAKLALMADMGAKRTGSLGPSTDWQLRTSDI